MKEGPDISKLASLIGDPARANILTALMAGKALTASELAREASITAQTTSSHLGKLKAGGLVEVKAQGRHRYYGLANEEVARTLEALMGLAAQSGHLRTRTGPKDPALREARVCYNHLAGQAGIQMFRALKASGAFKISENGIELTECGVDQVTALGVDLEPLRGNRAPMCRECLDWSARESHLAGKLGRALFARIEALGWAKQRDGTRIVQFTEAGRAAFNEAFPAD